MTSPEIRPDTFAELRVYGESYLVNAKYDRIDYFPILGHYILKMLDDEVGLISMHLEEEPALKIVEEAELPLVERTHIHQSEYEGYLDSVAARLEQAWDSN